jgi:Mrp family chromosome partitioning ATPase
VFQPALEVDAFRYNDVCRALTDEHRAAWHEALKAVAESIEAGATLIGVAGARGGVGCTTALVCLGRLLAEHGVRGAWLDGHFAQPGLADALSVAAEIGWEDVLAGRVGLAECMIQSITDDVALAPLTFGGAPASEKLDALHASMTAGILRYHYDVTLVDLGALDAAFQVDVARRLARQLRLDAVLWVDDTPSAAGEGRARLASVAPELAELYLGDIANFFAAS